MKRAFSRLAAIASAAVAISAMPAYSEGAKDSGGTGKLNFPRRAIEMVVPFGPGGSSDMMTRTVAQLMKKYIDKPINVVNKAGGGTTDGMVYANGQEADGHTILQVTPSLPIIEAQNRAPVKFSENFIPIGNFQIDIQSFGVSAKNRNFKTLEEMIAYAKANPGKVKIGGTSPGGLDDYMARGFAKAAGIELLYVPYKSAAETKSALLGGEIDVYQDKLISFLPMLQGGDVVPIVTLYHRRLTEVPEMKDVPCTVEKGINFTQGSWRGYAVKKGTPPEVVKFLEDVLKKCYESEEYKAIAAKDKSDLIPGYISAEEYGKLWQSELEGFKKVFGK